MSSQTQKDGKTIKRHEEKMKIILHNFTEKIVSTGHITLKEYNKIQRSYSADWKAYCRMEQSVHRNDEGYIYPNVTAFDDTCRATMQPFKNKTMEFNMDKTTYNVYLITSRIKIYLNKHPKLFWKIIRQIKNSWGLK